MSPSLHNPPTLDDLPVSVFRLDAGGRVLFANRRTCEQHRVTPAAALGRTCEQLGMPAAECLRLRAELTVVVGGGVPSAFEHLCTATGTERLIEYRMTPEPGRTVLVVAVTIDEVRQLRASLSAQEELFRAFLDRVPAIAWLRDADDRYVFTNRTYLDHYGLTAADRLGKTPAEVFPPAVTAVLRANDDRVRTAGRAVRVEEIVPDPDGTPRTWLNVKFPFTGADGRTFLGGVGVDVTAEKAAEAVRRQADAELAVAQRLDSLGLLAAGAAHDFNNLLTIVLGSAALARLTVPPGGDADEYLRQIEDSGRQAADLCRQMLSFAGRGAVGDRPVAVSELAHDTARVARTLVPAGAAVRLDLAADLPPVRADPTQLRQVVLNLLTNAADAMIGRTGTITVRTERAAGGRVRLAVADDGCGMPADVRARVFDPFFTTKPGGRGLGLAAVAGIVRGLRGSIAVASEPDRGTTVTVELPAEGGG